MAFDDGKRRVELWHLGVAHTHGDGFALAAEGKDPLHRRRVCAPVLPTTWATATRAAWVETLAEARKLGPTVVAPAHGPAGDGGVIDAQRQFFIDLRSGVERRKGLPPDRVQAEVSAIRDSLLKRRATSVDTSEKPATSFEAQVAQVYKEITGKEFPKKAALEDARRQHNRQHGIGDAQ